jgi:polyhydroxyalkanoate synthesis regulator phasin
MAGSNSSDRSRKARAPQKTAAGRPPKGSGSRSGSSKRPSQATGRSAPSKRASQAAARQLRREASRPGRPGSSGSARRPGGKGRQASAPKPDGLTGLAEQLANRILKPLGLVVLSRERIAETLGEAADGGHLTRTAAERLVSELVQLGREQTDELLSDLDRTLGRGRQGLDGASRRARKVTADRLMRGADRARRTIGVGPAFPILGYDDLTVAQVQNRLPHLSDPELRAVRDYERRHGNRKSLLGAIEKALG